MALLLGETAGSVYTCYYCKKDVSGDDLRRAPVDNAGVPTESLFYGSVASCVVCCDKAVHLSPTQLSEWVVTGAEWPENARVVARLMAAVFSVPEDQEFSDTLKSTGAYLVRNPDDGELIGALTYTRTPSVVSAKSTHTHVDSLGTRLGYRKRGVGDALMREVVGQHGSKGDITLAVAKWEAEKLGKFYEKYGFVPSGRRNRNDNEIWERRMQVRVAAAQGTPRCVTM